MSKDQIPNTTPQEQFRHDVLPPYEAYMSDKGTEWLARAAGDAVAHFAEHVYVYYHYHDQAELHGAESPEEYVDYLADNNHCVELMIIWDFALSGKHRFLTRKSRRHRFSSTATTAVTPEIIAGAPRFVTGSTDSIIAGSSDSGTTHVEGLWMPDCDRWFEDVLEKAVDFWRGWLPTAPIYP